MLPVATNSEATALEMPFNARTGNEYSGSNILALQIAGFSDLRWGGYNQWLEVGRVVDKGQKSTPIMMVQAKNVERDQGDTAPQAAGTSDAVRKSRFVRMVPVFNFEQTIPISADDAKKILDAKAARREAKAANPQPSAKRSKRKARS